MTLNDIKAGDVLVRPDRKCTVIEVGEAEQGKLRMVVYDPKFQRQGIEIVPASKRTMEIPAGFVERS